MLSFVCSVGNVPLAAVLWSGGISFAGVIAFIFADLIVLPIVAAYIKYYGREYALRITALMFVTIVISALVIDGLFSLVGLIPDTRPSRSDIFGSVELDYKLVLNLLGVAIFVALFWPDRAPRRDRPGLRDEGGPLEGAARRARRPHPLLLLRGVPRPVQGGPRRVHRERARTSRGARGRPRSLMEASSADPDSAPSSMGSRSRRRTTASPAA